MNKLADIRSEEAGVSAISQKTLNKLVEDFDLLYRALLPFAKLAEIFPITDNGTPLFSDNATMACIRNTKVTVGDFREALKLCTRISAEEETRRVAVAERKMAGKGDFCRMCLHVIEGSDKHELEGYCSITCQREAAPKPPITSEMADAAFALFGIPDISKIK
jgi:hypothetical protein